MCKPSSLAFAYLRTLSNSYLALQSASDPNLERKESAAAVMQIGTPANKSVLCCHAGRRVQHEGKLFASKQCFGIRQIICGFMPSEVALL